MSELGKTTDQYRHEKIFPLSQTHLTAGIKSISTYLILYLFCVFATCYNMTISFTDRRGSWTGNRRSRIESYECKSFTAIQWGLGHHASSI